MVETTWEQRNKHEERLSAMKRVREPRLQHWRNVQEFLIPYQGRFLTTERDRHVDRWSQIINECGSFALRVAVSGLMATRTNPMLRWYRPRTPDEEVNKSQPAAEWLDRLGDLINNILHKSKSYLAIPKLYGETLPFGTGADIVHDSFKTIIKHTSLTAGEFVFDVDEDNEPDRIYREYLMTVHQLVGEFGIENVSSTVREMYKHDRADRHSTVRVVHVIEPRDFADRNYGSPLAVDMPWKSCYYEADNESTAYLRESGHRWFPGIVSRWDTNGGDVWGEGPGTMALGSTRELQFLEMLKAKAFEYQADPPRQVPTQSKGRDVDLLPGGLYPYDQTNPSGGVRVAFTSPLNLDQAAARIAEVCERINRSFHVDLWQPLSHLPPTTERTKYELMLRSNEALTILGPVTHRLEHEQDKPLLNIILNRIFELQLMPPAPEEMQGMTLEIEFIGPLAQALKETQVGQHDKFRMIVGQIASIPGKEDASDYYDADNDIIEMADRLGVDPSVVFGGQKVALIRQGRAESQQAAAQLQAATLAGKATRDFAAAGAV